MALSSVSKSLLEAWISRDIRADLIFYGDVLGTKSGESAQVLKSYDYEEGLLTLKFDSTERLYLYDPTDCVENFESDLCIESAKKLIFGWHSYGKPQTDENWCTYTYEKVDDGNVQLAVTGTMREHLKRFGDPDKTFPSRGHPAVWMSPPQMGRWTGNL